MGWHKAMLNNYVVASEMIMALHCGKKLFVCIHLSTFRIYTKNG